MVTRTSAEFTRLSRHSLHHGVVSIAHKEMHFPNHFVSTTGVVDWPVCAEVLLEEVVLNHLSECRVIGYPLVQFEVQVDDFLDDLFYLVVKGNPHVLQRVDLGSDL